MDMTAASLPGLDEESENRSNMNAQLMLNYENLMNEKKRVEMLIREYESLEDINKNTSLSVNQKYSSYIAVTFFLIVLIILFVLFYVA